MGQEILKKYAERSFENEVENDEFNGEGSRYGSESDIFANVEQQNIQEEGIASVNEEDGKKSDNRGEYLDRFVSPINPDDDLENEVINLKNSAL